MSAMGDDWTDLKAFLPNGWEEMAQATSATKGLRKDKSPDALLRTLLIHFACGYSLRETSIRAREAGLAEMSDVALLKRLRKCKEWLRTMCERLFQERGIPLNANTGRQFRIFDATDVKEPGKTGSIWRVHYSVRIPDLACDFFKLTATRGKGAGETCSQFPVAKGDFIIVDRGYSKGLGIGHAASHGGYVCIRINPAATWQLEPNGELFPLKAQLRKLRSGGPAMEWPVAIRIGDGGSLLPGRLCAIRKLEKDIAIAKKRRRRDASKRMRQLSGNVLFFAEHVMLFSTFPKEEFSTREVLDAYRLRWQVELVFKRFKQIARFGHLPKHDDESSKAWLYGKLLVALLAEKLIAHAGEISPWRHDAEEDSEERMGGIRFHVSSNSEGRRTSLGPIENIFTLA